VYNILEQTDYFPEAAADMLVAYAEIRQMRGPMGAAGRGGAAATGRAADGGAGAHIATVADRLVGKELKGPLLVRIAVCFPWQCALHAHHPTPPHPSSPNPSSPNPFGPSRQRGRPDSAKC
jgi:hypothetical protein